MEKQLPYLEQQHCIFHGIARIASINPHTLTPELRQVRDNMIKAMGLNAFMVDRGLKSSKNSQKKGDS
ncbi:hypothetical protein [Lactiplantibacillus plantarum]|uniref:hypothetical protein n=1 Tax=Lactiplantibacillus plantarum TaxID=1590 RepID=UPI000975A8C9|nr:hypothetical protein [Lactiplantibacillus plantarum]